MIAYAVMLLTDLEDVEEADTIDVVYGTRKLGLSGVVVRSFVRSTNHAYHDFPYDDCLSYGLSLVPPPLRPIFKYLYETLKETILWDEQSSEFG